jgi:hypothetical protein
MFLDAFSSAAAFFVAWAPFEQPNIARALDFHRQHYIGIRTAEEYRDRERTTDGSSDDEQTCDDHDVLQRTRSDTIRAVHSYSTVPVELYDFADDVDMDQSQPTVPITEHPTAVQRLILHAMASSTLPPDNTNVLVVNTDTITRSHVVAFLREHSITGPQCPTQTLVTLRSNRRVLSLKHTSILSATCVEIMISLPITRPSTTLPSTRYHDTTN